MFGPHATTCNNSGSVKSIHLKLSNSDNCFWQYIFVFTFVFIWKLMSVREINFKNEMKPMLLIGKFKKNNQSLLIAISTKVFKQNEN